MYKTFAAFTWESVTVGFGTLPHLEVCISAWPWFETELPRSNRAKIFLALLYAIKSTKEIKYSTLHQVAQLWVKPAKARKNGIRYLSSVYLCILMLRCMLDSNWLLSGFSVGQKKTWMKAALNFSLTPLAAENWFNFIAFDALSFLKITPKSQEFSTTAC